MRFLCLIYCDERVLGDRPQTDREASGAECVAYVKGLKADGRCIASSPLAPVATATTVRLRDGETFVTDGPFAETKEQLLGFILVEARDIDEAVEIASRHPVARIGCIEVRPLADLPPHLQELIAP